MGKEFFWLITSWLQMLAGTFLGAYAAFLFVGGRTFYDRLRDGLKDHRSALLLVASGMVILFNGLLNPFYSSDGTMQTGLVGLCLAGFLTLSIWLAKGSIRRWSWAIGITTAFCTIPWLVLNLGVSFGLCYSETFRSKFISGSEGDWDRLQANHLVPLGLSVFPLLQLVLLMLLAIVGLLYRIAAQRSIRN